MFRYGKGDAVWTITQDDVTIKITLDGVETVEQLPSDAIARKRFDILCTRQGREGWKRRKDEAPRFDQVEVPATVTENARNPALEAQILASPLDPEPYRIYGDWLDQQGDPRGQLVALMLAREIKKEHARLKAQTESYHERIASYVNRGVVDAGECFVRWARGFIASIHYLGGELGPPLRQTLATPSARFVHTIQLDDDGHGNLRDALDVVAADAPPTLRTLMIGGQVSLADLAPLIAVLPRLQRFEIFSTERRELVLAPIAWRQLLTSPFPHLGRLHLDLASANDISQLGLLFGRTDLPALTQLGFTSKRVPEVLGVLAGSHIATRLTRLVLDGPLQAELWTQVRPQFPRLTQLVIDTTAWNGAQHRQAETNGLTIRHVVSDEPRLGKAERAIAALSSDEREELRARHAAEAFAAEDRFTGVRE